MHTDVEHRAGRITLPTRLARASYMITGDFSAQLGDVRSFPFGVARDAEEHCSA